MSHETAAPLTIVAGVCAGAAAMYYLDPAQGRRRRAAVFDSLAHAARRTDKGMRTAARDLRNRAAGTASTVRHWRDAGDVDDVVLEQRVRACLGRVVTHPSSIGVAAAGGVVELSGPILSDEAPLLVDSVLGVPGVKDVSNRLDLHVEAGNVPGLQGEPPRRRATRAAFARETWPPGARLVGGLAGAAIAMCGLARRDAAGALLGAAGMLLLGRSAANVEARRLIGLGKPRHAVDVRKTLRIDAPVEDVFRAWDDFESFPRFMTHVRRVERIPGDGGSQWRWTIDGTRAGMKALSAEFDSKVTAREENRLLAWRTDGSALVRHAGQAQFRANPDGSTTVSVRLAYQPPAGAAGHAIARLFGVDPKRLMDDDLLRMKSYLETGRTPRDAAEARSEQGGNASVTNTAAAAASPERAGSV